MDPKEFEKMYDGMPDALKAKDNLLFYQRFMAVMGPSMMNLNSNMQDAIKRMSKEEE